MVGNALTPDAIASLVLAEMPFLFYLTLGNNALDATAAKHLASGTWCHLAHSNLDNNNLCDIALALLPKDIGQHCLI